MRRLIVKSTGFSNVILRSPNEFGRRGISRHHPELGEGFLAKAVLSGIRFFATLRVTRGEGLRMANQCYYDDLGHHEKPISQQADLLEEKAVLECTGEKGISL